jgi:hypothetical protein
MQKTDLELWQSRKVSVAQNYFLKTAWHIVFIIKNCRVNAEHYSSKYRFTFIAFTDYTKTFINEQPTHN